MLIDLWLRWGEEVVMEMFSKRLIMENGCTVLERVTVARKGLQKVKEQLKDENYTGKDTALKQSNVKEKEMRLPGLRSDLCTYFIVIVKDDTSNTKRNAKPIKGKLN